MAFSKAGPGIEALYATSRIVREVVAILPLLEDDVANLHLHEEFAWVQPLDEEERHQMKLDFAESLRSALLTGDWSEYEDMRYSWRETARTLQDPVLSAALGGERDPAQEVALRRP